MRSAAIPGWGQWASGRRRRGAVLVGLTLALVGPLVALVALLVLALGAAFFPSLASVAPVPVALGRVFPNESGPVASPPSQAGSSALLSLAVGIGAATTDLVWRAGWAGLGTVAAAANLLLCALRGWVAVDAAHGARPSRPVPLLPLASPWWRRRVGPVAALGAALLVLGPHAAVATMGYVGSTRLMRIFVGPPAGPPRTPPATTTAGAGPADETITGEAGSALPSGPVPSADAFPVGAWDGTGRLNVLLLGSDRRPEEAATGAWGNSDTILLLSVDPGLRGAALVSVPRDLSVQLPGVGGEKVNAAFRIGGPSLAQRVVGDLLGVPIHHWAAVDVRALAHLVDALGGVVVDVERPLRDDTYPNEDYSVRRVLLPAGLQWLDGERALWYARSRHGSNDFDRADRQQHLLLALRARLTDPQVLVRLPVVLDLGASTVQTDLAPRELFALARLATAPGAGAAGVRRLVLTPPVYGHEVVRPDLYLITPDRARIRGAVAALLAGDATADASARPSPPVP